MASTELGTGSGYSVLARRNNSLTPATRLLAFCAIALVCIGIAGAFALAGAPYVLPFAGVELAGLAYAFYWIERHAGDYERVTLRGDVLEIEVGEAQRVERRIFNPQWALVSCDGEGLAVREQGRSFRFGRLMTRDERARVAQALRRRAGPADPDQVPRGRRQDSSIAS